MRGVHVKRDHPFPTECALCGVKGLRKDSQWRAHEASGTHQQRVQLAEAVDASSGASSDPSTSASPAASTSTSSPAWTPISSKYAVLTKLKRKMRGKRVTQAALAKAVFSGDKASVKRILNGQDCPTRPQIELLASTLGVNRLAMLHAWYREA